MLVGDSVTKRLTRRAFGLLETPQAILRFPLRHSAGISPDFPHNSPPVAGRALAIEREDTARGRLPKGAVGDFETE